MTLLAWVQLFVDVLFLFLILVLLLARGWRRGPSGVPGSEEQESYRGMVATLSEMIRTMKETTAEMQERLSEKQAEIQHTVTAAEDRLARLKEELKAAEVRPRRSVQTASSGPAEPAVGIAPAESPEQGPASQDGKTNKEEERRAKYRQALEFMEKGWSALDIARFTQLPRGEVEFLMRTKGKRQ